MVDSLRFHNHYFMVRLTHVFGPALLISLVFHGVLILIPLPRQTAVNSNLSPSEPAILETVNLADLLGDSNPPVPLVSSSPPQEYSVPIDAPISEKGEVRQLLQKSAPLLAQNESLTATVDSSPDMEPAFNASPEFTQEAGENTSDSLSDDNPETMQNFFDQLSATAGVSVGSISPELLPDPSFYFESTETESVLLPNVLRAVLMEGKTPDQVYIFVLSSQLQTGNFQTIQKSDYGGGTVYEVTQGEKVWYLNLVPANGGKGTVIIVWNQDPNRIQPA